MTISGTSSLVCHPNTTLLTPSDGLQYLLDRKEETEHHQGATANRNHQENHRVPGGKRDVPGAAGAKPAPPDRGVAPPFTAADPLTTERSSPSPPLSLSLSSTIKGVGIDRTCVLLPLYYSATSSRSRSSHLRFDDS